MGETAMELGSWAVVYTDGEVVAQYDAQHPRFLRDAGEVPFRAIDWSRVAQVWFENQWVKTIFDVVHPGPGYQLSLRSRTWTTNTAEGSAMTMAFVILTTTADTNLDDVAALRANTVEATFWFPNGVTHTTPLFDSPHVAQYAQDLCKHNLLGTPIPDLMPEHRTVPVSVEGVLTNQ